MPKITFYVRKKQPDKQGLCAIWIKIIINDKTFTRPLGHKIKPYHWSKKKEVKEPGKSERPPYDYKVINEMIDWYKINWSNLITNRNLDLISDDTIQDFLDRKSEIKKMQFTTPGFFEAFEEYIEYNKTKRMKPWKYNTVRNKNTVLNVLKKWQKETRFDACFQNINQKMYDSIVEWCNKKKYSLNNQAKIVVTLKAFLNWCSDEERNYCPEANFKKFKATTNDVTLVYLTKEEFFAIYDLELKSKILSKARDIFCFGCLTGQRVSDLINLRHDHIVNDTWYVTTEKTETQHAIYLDSKAREIMSRYHHPIFVLPRLSLGGKSGLNKSIKEVCRKAGITDKMAIVTYPGGKRKETIYEKCDKITMHVARKSYATIMLSENVQAKIIRSGTGHKRDAVFDKYAFTVNELKRSETERAFQRPRKKIINGEPLKIEEMDESIKQELLGGLEIKIFKEDDLFTVHCPLLDITGSGKTEEEAKNSFKIVFQEHIRQLKIKN